MGVLLAFAVGYAVGSKAGRQGYDDLTESLKAIRESEEFAAMLTALRSHAAHALRGLAEFVGDEERTMTMDDLVSRVRALARQVDPRTSGATSSAS